MHSIPVHFPCARIKRWGKSISLLTANRKWISNHVQKGVLSLQSRYSFPGCSSLINPEKPLFKQNHFLKKGSQKGKVKLYIHYSFSCYLIVVFVKYNIYIIQNRHTSWCLIFKMTHTVNNNWLNYLYFSNSNRKNKMKAVFALFLFPCILLPSLINAAGRPKKAAEIQIAGVFS